MTTYKNLCSTYYDLDMAHGATQELPFYTVYAQQANGPILEPMCGTGNFLIPLTKAGFAIEGFDASPFMLEQLQKKAHAIGVSCTVWQGFLQDLSQTTLYNLIFIPNASFNLLVDVTEIMHCLQIMWHHLAPNGLLVFECLTTHAIPTPINVWTHKARMLSDDASIQVHSLTLPVVDAIVTTTHRYKLVIDSTVIQTEEETYRLKLHEPALMEKLLKHVGFSCIKQVKAFDHHKKPEASDDLVVFECHK